MHIDVARAYFYANARRDTYVKIPWEIQEEMPGADVRKVEAMSGARCAAQR